MSFWTEFRDQALRGAGLKNGAGAAVAVGNIARPTFQRAVGSGTVNTTAPADQQLVDASGGGTSNFLKNNKWIGPVFMIAGAAILLKLKKS